METVCRRKYFREAENETTFMEEVYLTFSCGCRRNPKMYVNQFQGTVSIATSPQCRCQNTQAISLHIGNHCIQHLFQVFPVNSFLYYLNNS